MDIQKEREAFEKHASKFFITNEAFEDDGENYVYDEVKFMWDCWLAAKAQAVPEGFALISQKDLLELTIAINAVDLATHTESKTNEVREMWQDIALKLMVLGGSQS